MRIVPSDTPLITVETGGSEVGAMAAVKPAKPVQTRTLVPFLVLPHAEEKSATGTSGNIAQLPDSRHDPHLHGERRVYCRRVQHLPILIELRSGPDRRRHNQRGSDALEHVDTKA